MILYGLLLPQRTSRTPSGVEANTLPLVVRIFSNVIIFMETPITPCCTPNWGSLFVCGKLLLLVAAITIRFLRLMALVGCVALFATHVTLQRLGRTVGDAEDTNMRASLNLFYGLAGAQALLSYMVVVFTSSREKLVAELRDGRGLSDLDDELLGLYYAHVRRTCRTQGARFALQATLIRFALESITSATHSVRQSGVETLHILVASTTSYAEKAALKTRDSPAAMESLFWMATLASPDERPKRARAACILARLSGAGILLSGIPSAVPSICSLLEEVHVHSRSDDPVSAETNLVHKGLEILERLSSTADNLAEICSSDHLMSILTEVTSREQVPAASGTGSLKAATTSLIVLTRLTCAVDNQGAMLRKVILRKVLLMSNVRAILWNPNADRRLRMLAVQSVAGFGFDSESRDSTAARSMVAPLLGILCGSSPGGGSRRHDGELMLEAGKALEMLTTESKPNCAAILEEAGNEDFQALRGMLFDESRTAGRATVARILANLCAYSDPGSNEILAAFITDNISEVLRRTCDVQDHATEDLEPFLCLGLRFAKWTSAQDFIDALDKIGREIYIRKLVLTVQANQRPGVLRFAIEQAIWIVKHEQELLCVQQLRSNGMVEALLHLQGGVVAMMDDYKLLSPSGAVLEHKEPLPSIVRRATKLICRSA
ncbi:hypothetical protein ACP70R_018721 [Stipagrostis hirtigluma subsp. patula]